ncbi:GNAT family N-acetyltransferase [Shewanella surugensis]|uniref:GNAT family N-acetyltransferase n=1 Tax=Shewanella surugensis TaxID=212020 RepID=A0ABT0LEK4_9GAMM|nr:GNAT family N-acetyltransferase [Shewanella surugensis]MCL1126138.1 GNAT family N-acetyltransferase [Shewanella surugensis]
MFIRKAIPSDINEMSALMMCSAKQHITPILDEKAEVLLLNSMSTDKLAQYFDEDHDYYVAIIDDQIVGLIGMKAVSHLLHLFVSDAFQGRGLARRLWKTAKMAALNGAELMAFTVNSAINAQKVYKKLGFVPIDGIRTCNGFSDIPMTLTLSNVDEKAE